MKKKIIIIAAAAVLLICLCVYFRPLKFSNVLNENDQLTITLNELGVNDGEPYNEFTNYDAVTDEQKSAVFDILGQYRYRRTFGTLFSNGGIALKGAKQLYINTFEESAITGVLVVSSSGKIVITSKPYHMKNAEELIEEILDIVE